MKIIKIIWMFIFIALLTHCYDFRHPCPNKIAHLPFPYSSGTKVYFKNNTDSIISYIVSFQSRGPGENAKDDAGHYLCQASRRMIIGDFTYVYYQTDNWTRNCVSTRAFFNTNSYKIIDSLDYNFIGTSIRAYHYVFLSSVPDSLIKGDYYDQFYLSKDSRLLQYAVYRNNIHETWYLK